MITEEISADSIFKNYEHDGSKRTTASSNYDSPWEVSRPPPRDKTDRCMQHNWSSDKKRNNHEHSSYGEVKSSHELTPAISNKPCSDDDPHIPRTINREKNNEKRSLGFSIAERSNDVTSRPRLRLGQKARLPAQQYMENGCSAKASSVMDLGNSKALITNPIREEESLERNKRDVENLGLTTQQMGLSSTPLKDCKRVKIGNPSKKAHNVVKLDRVLSRMRNSSLKAQFKLCSSRSNAPKKRCLGFSKKPNSKAIAPSISSDTINENSQSSPETGDRAKNNYSMIVDGTTSESLTDGNIVNMNNLIIQNQEKLGAEEIWDIGKKLGL
ncbi:hypothetical protein Ancab_034531 [Ancistrocladus abbreviatus]